MSYFEHNATKAGMPSKPAPIAVYSRDSRSEWTANLQLRTVRK